MGVIALLILFPDQIEAIFGEMGYTNPAFVVAVYSPGIVGVFLVWRHYGLKGLLSFFRRLTLWRMSLAWWLVLVIGMPAVFYVGAAIKGTLTDPFPFSPWYGVLPALAIALIIGPIEESTRVPCRPGRLTSRCRRDWWRLRQWLKGSMF
jgi:uncharacterized protein